MRAAALALLVWALSVTAAEAGLSKAALDLAQAAPPPGARLDPDLAARDVDGRLQRIQGLIAGRTTFLVFADYTCNTLCGTELALLSDAIERAELPATAFRILVLGIDPRDSPQSARAMAEREIPPALLGSTILLLPDPATVSLATAALGYRYAYDAAIDQFAHPAAVYVLGGDGALRAVLSPFALTVGDLRQALTASPRPSLIRRIRQLCYAYDPVTGIYDLRIGLLLKLAAATTVGLLGGAILLLARAGRRAG